MTVSQSCRMISTQVIPRYGLDHSKVPASPLRRSFDFQAPELHVEIHKHGLGQQAVGASAGPSSTSSSAKTSKKKKSSDLKYDVFGWVILAVGIIAWVGFAKSHMPPPPPTPR